MAWIITARAFFSRIPSWAWIVGAIIIAGIAALIWLDRHDQAVVENHDKDVSIEAANRMIAADREATTNQTARDETFAKSQQELRYEVRTKGSGDAVGPGVTSVLERMRREQAAANRPPAR